MVTGKADSPQSVCGQHVAPELPVTSEVSLDCGSGCRRPRVTPPAGTRTRVVPDGGCLGVAWGERGGCAGGQAQTWKCSRPDVGTAAR